MKTIYLKIWKALYSPDCLWVVCLWVVWNHDPKRLRDFIIYLISELNWTGLDGGMGGWEDGRMGG